MSQSFSLQRRLGFGLTLGVVVLWLVATMLTVLIVQHSINKTLDSSLEETAQRILSLAVVEILNRDSTDLLQQVAALKPHDEYITYVVRDSEGTPLLASHDINLSAFPDTPQVGLRSTETHRLYGISAVSETIFIEAAEPLTYRQRATREMLAMLLLPLAVMVPLSLIGIWWFVRYSLGGLLAYRQALEVRDAGDLSSLETYHLPSELVPVAEAVDQLLARLRRTLEAERSFNANSAHELRTPLAAALAQVQRLCSEAPPGPLLERARQIESSLQQLSRLSEKLMQLAKSESSKLLIEVPQDIRPVVTHVVNDFCRAPEVHLEVTLPKDVPVLSSLDPDALAILLRNLIENALKYGAQQQPVEVILTREGCLSVINAGQVVPEEVLATLTDRFQRYSTQAGGAGLGLAIVSAITTGAGLRLQLASPARGRKEGFSASLHLL
ncbi:sensor histidine kinase [Halomonas halocynthiae]|uniref:sensor histidine kinase n=1 Tax=Halomonas halocynthiae TaxID=176290 RepID=UPI0004235DB9|nr:ATP-binding protein [Halomonas halocynthiae]